MEYMRWMDSMAEVTDEANYPEEIKAASKIVDESTDMTQEQEFEFFAGVSVDFFLNNVHGKTVPVAELEG